MVCSDIGNGNTSLIALGKSAALQQPVHDFIGARRGRRGEIQRVKPKSTGASAVKLLRPLKLSRKVFTLPGSICGEDNPLSYHRQPNSRPIPVQICADMCKTRLLVPFPWLRTPPAVTVSDIAHDHRVPYPRVSTIRFVRRSYTTYCLLFCAASSSIRFLADTKSRAASTQISSASICSKISY